MLYLSPATANGRRWRIVGSAVEHAAQRAAELNPDIDHLPDQVLDFGKLFLDQEADDEDATGLAECLHSLVRDVLRAVRGR